MSTDPAIYGLDLFGDPIMPPSRGKLADSFVVPPFSVLNAREGFWQERRRAWIGSGIKSEIGRDAKSYNVGDWMAEHGGGSRGEESGLSIFDPVLCEILYRWFCPDGGTILDPFAGGSVRGIVASSLGRSYCGVELRIEQVESNREQAATICDQRDPVWVQGDACDLDSLPGVPPQCDFVFSCPPYADLERYSDDPRDLSTMEYHTFIPAYRLAILKACKRLRQDRFAAFVVGDIRDSKGNYRNFVSDTIAAFQLAGLQLYNEAILVTSVGSLPIRVPKQFAASRKLGKTHQNVLVFVKGSGKAAAKICGEVPK